MAPRKRKKKQIDEGPFLFSEDEMSGMIENVTVIDSSGHEKMDIPPAPEALAEDPLTVKVETHIDTVNQPEQKSESMVLSLQPVDELSTDERIIVAMTNVLWQMKHMGKSQIRRIAFSITVMCQQGLELNKKYSVPILQDDEISGYELAAWCYCTFITAFPSMLDKLQLPYAEHYAKAKANIG